MKKPEIQEAIIVEGRYDRNTVSQVVDALIVVLDGFQIFKKSDIRSYILNLAEKKGIVVLTDSDSAGFLLRKEIRSFVPNHLIKDAYIPDLEGKEKRKRKPGKEGKIGVEGMRPEVILKALKESGAVFLEEEPAMSETFDEAPVTMADLYTLKLIGCPDCSKRKCSLLKQLNLPEHLSSKDLLQVINRSMSATEFVQLVHKLERGWVF